MKATLLVGDYLFVSKYSYGYSHYSLPFSPPLVHRPHRRLRHAGARRRRRVPPAEGRLHRLHQARDRPAGRPHPDDRRRAAHQRRAGASASAIEDFIDDDEGGRATGCKRWRETLPNGVSYTTLDLLDNGFSTTTREVYRRAARQLFHDGRQPRQLDRQPRSRRSATCRSRTSSAAPRSSSSRSARASAPGRSGAGRGRCAGAGCSRSCDEARGQVRRSQTRSARNERAARAADARSQPLAAKRKRPQTRRCDERAGKDHRLSLQGPRTARARADPHLGARRRQPRRQLSAAGISRRPRARAGRLRHAVSRLSARPTRASCRGGSPISCAAKPAPTWRARSISARRSGSALRRPTPAAGGAPRSSPTSARR